MGLRIWVVMATTRLVAVAAVILAVAEEANWAVVVVDQVMFRY
jgi:hypothetical protein